MIELEVLVPTVHDGISVNMSNTVALEQMRKIWDEQESAQLRRIRDIALTVSRHDVSAEQIYGGSDSTIYRLRCHDADEPAVKAEFHKRDLQCVISGSNGLKHEERISSEEQERRLFVPDGKAKQ